VEIFKNLAKAELFEDFLNKKFQAKRFGLNGGEALIPSLEVLCEVASSHGVENLVFGMPHRGRLSVMANTLGKPLPLMFNEFDMHKAELAASVQGTGDVKYHLGASSDRFFNDRRLHMSMTANPSHLEAVNPVVEGKTRAKQESQGKVNFNKAMRFSPSSSLLFSSLFFSSLLFSIFSSLLDLLDLLFSPLSFCPSFCELSPALFGSIRFDSMDV